MRVVNSTDLVLSIRNILVGALHMLTLAGFFIAQPLFSLLASNGEFFIARVLLPLLGTDNLTPVNG
jgi:hypothetical protein